MRDYTLAHVSDAVLLRDLAALVDRDRVTTATLLAHIAEVDARKLYVPAGYSSMHAYCVDELRLSEDAASKRIHAARAARRFPALLYALAEGRLHLGAVCLLAPHLTPGNVRMLTEAATHKRKSEIEEWLALRFPIPEVPARVRAVPNTAEDSVALAGFNSQLAPRTVGTDSSGAAGVLDEHAPGHVGGAQAQAQSRVRFQILITKSVHEKLRYAQELLSHAVPTGDTSQVFERALDVLITQLEKRKLGSTTRRLRRVRSTSESRPRSRYIPAQVRRAVWERDEGRCTFVSASGTRCKARRFLEFDHVDPVARGGGATVDRIRLRCRAHNQYEAERSFGVGFMNRKRHEARLQAGAARVPAAKARARAGPATAPAADDIVLARDVAAGLRNLGCRADEARRAAAFTGTLGSATLEERMRVALRFLGSPMRRASSPPG
jgi:5-methylcytosine-specific restriction endonuclease McrA